MVATQDSASTKDSRRASQLPAGGLDPSRFEWAEAWYPVHYTKDLSKTKLTRFTLLEQNLVIWWEPQTQSWRVFSDRCPHRLAPLSEGRINEAGLLECLYHGWAFSGNGQCQKIPQQPPDGEAHLAERACANSLPVSVRQGLLFVYPGKPENAARVSIPTIEPLEANAEDWTTIDTFRDLPYDALTLLENFSDVSHTSYAHHNTMSKRENAAPIRMDIISSGRQGFEGIWPEGPRKGKLGTQKTTFVAPSLMYHDLTSSRIGRTLIVAYATPICKGKCRVFARFPFKFSSKLPGLLVGLIPRWYGHIRNNQILEDDLVLLHLQERLLEKAGVGASKTMSDWAIASLSQNSQYTTACYLPTQADRYVVAFRRWVRVFSADPFPQQILPPAGSLEILVDRYYSHTKHCSSCYSTLRRIRKIRKVISIVGIALWALLPSIAMLFNSVSPLLGVLLAMISLTVGISWLWIGKLEQDFCKGKTTPPRNLPDRRA